jgi:hypothetical protein
MTASGGSGRSRSWLVAVLSGLVAAGATLALIEGGRLDGILRPVPRLDSFEATVVAVTNDRDGVGILREDGTEEGFELSVGTPGASLLERGERVLVDVAYLEDHAPDPGAARSVRSPPRFHLGREHAFAGNRASAASATRD